VQTTGRRASANMAAALSNQACGMQMFASAGDLAALDVVRSRRLGGMRHKCWGAGSDGQKSSGCK
jgi:hypothetical protein